MIVALSVLAFAAFVFGAFFRWPLLFVLASVTLFGTAPVLMALGTSVLPALGWSLVAMVVVDLAFLAGNAAGYGVKALLKRDAASERRAAQRRVSLPRPLFAPPTRVVR